MTVMKIAGIQMNSAFEDIDSNLKKAQKFIKEAAEHNADTVILSEMFATGFSLNPELAQDTHGSIIQFLCAQAKKLKINIIAGYMALKADGIKNSAVVIDRNGRIAAEYSKINLFKQQNEHMVFKSGTAPLIVNLDGVNIAMFICFDLRFPKIYQSVAKMSDVMVTIAAWPKIRQEHFDTLLKARAIENQCYSAGINQTGSCNGIMYYGGSAVIAPDGTVVAQEYDSETLIISTVDTDNVKKLRASFLL